MLEHIPKSGSNLYSFSQTFSIANNATSFDNDNEKLTNFYY